MCDKKVFSPTPTPTPTPYPTPTPTPSLPLSYPHPFILHHSFCSPINNLIEKEVSNSPVEYIQNVMFILCDGNFSSFLWKLNCINFGLKYCDVNEKVLLVGTYIKFGLQFTKSLTTQYTVAASSSLDSHIRIWDLETGKQLKAIDCGPGTKICYVSYS